MTATAAIVGTTTWGTTLGITLARNEVPVTILARTPVEADRLNQHRENRRFLPSVQFPSLLKVSSDLAATIERADLVILAVPTEHFRSNLQQITPYLASGATVVSASKGLELPEGYRMSQVLEAVLPPEMHEGICVLSGPNLAREVAEEKPGASVVAGRNDERTALVQSMLMSQAFRVYTSDDVIGVELGGTLKNIIALGAGIADGMEMGQNSKSTLITRGLAEITRLGTAAGAQPLTFAGLAGLGDLVATCYSQLSRNRFTGEQLARGRTWLEIRERMDNVVEGVNTTGAALAMAERLNVEMPITEVTYRILFEDLPPKNAIAELMGRPPHSEWSQLRLGE
ncbi:MAG: NAD(P)-dependent glycerol-3-phosphate dehydrogenase [Chloroflexi bacterium]|nr:NAD(P)-dependent glycerol-3-phosphate dehydrogenase [Chloroflexota bacterium]